MASLPNMFYDCNPVWLSFVWKDFFLFLWVFSRTAIRADETEAGGQIKDCSVWLQGAPFSADVSLEHVLPKLGA